MARHAGRSLKCGYSQVAQDNPFAQEGGCVGCLYGLFGLGFFTLNLLVFDSVEVNLAHSIDHVLIFESDKAKA